MSHAAKVDVRQREPTKPNTDGRIGMVHFR